MENVILIFVLAVILGGAIVYIAAAKRKGVKCIGCPAGGSCGHKCGSCNGCGGSEGCEAGQSSCECHEETK